ncbi:MAG: DUF3494 domain-containing protein [Deltaproteobacteria bacterium]|nr:DUF3494 domain-containing protein [Deltaproteobacteria bacterium]
MNEAGGRSKSRGSARSGWRGAGLAVVMAVTLFSVGGLASPAEASHFRFGHNTWNRVSGTTVQFTSTQAWRSDAVSPIPMDFGDGVSDIGTVNTIGTFTDVAGEQYTIVQYTVEHTYASEGPFLATTANCCRIYSLLNASGASFRVDTIVDLRGGNTGSPVSSIPVIVQMAQGAVNNVVLPIADPDGDGFTCRMATPVESEIPSVASAGGNDLGVSSGCVLSWDTSATAIGQKYAAQVAIEETHAGNLGRVALDFIIEIVGNLGASPACDGTSGNHIVNVGQPFAGNFTGTDADGGNLTLGHLGLPPGATLTPPSGTSQAQPFGATFDWTPQQADAGTAHAVTIVYTDPQNLQATCSFSINVPESVCGNNVVESPFETCDDGNTLSGDGCDANCQVETPASTTTTSTTTTTTLPATGACCADGLCSVTTAAQCEVGTYQGDGTNCDAPGTCAVCGDGLIESGEDCDDANTATGDGCDDTCNVEPCWACTADTAPTTTIPVLPGPSTCTPDDGASCDDGDICTVGDTCLGGTCDGDAVVIPAACRWVMVGDTSVQSRTRGETQVTGHICGGRVRIGEFTTTNGDAVATLASGVGIQISSHAAVTGDIVTGGSAVRGKPRLVLLPGLATDVVAGGSTAVQSGDPTAIYDTLGTNVRVDDCADAQGDVAAGDLMLAGLPPGPNLGDTFIAPNGSLTLTASSPGGLNVFDFRKLLSGADATLTLDGAGNAGSVFVLRVEKKLDLRLRSKIVLAGSTVPGNVIIYSQAKCRFGNEVTGAGTVFCPAGKLVLEERSVWQGALVGGKGRVELRNKGILVHAPLLVGP